MITDHYRLLLHEELSERKQRNAAYSLSAFAKSIGISPPALSQILSGKRPLSKKSVKKIFERCSFSEEKRALFFASALGVSIENTEEAASQSLEELQINEFRIIADWRHYAILSLSNVDKNQASATWIADQLGISLTSAKDALERLLQLGMIKKKGRGFYQAVHNFSLPNRSKEIALRHAHHEMLNKAKEELDKDEARMELYSSITMAIDETKLETARAMITKFRRQLCAFLEGGSQERVYSLALQLFPLSKPKEKVPS